MSNSAITKFTFGTVFFIVTIFFFSIPSTRAEADNCLGNGMVKVGSTPCHSISSNIDSKVKGLLDFYNSKFSLTSVKILTPSEVTAKTLAELDQLTVTLMTLKATVLNSKTLTEADKQKFLKQIDIIYAQILQLKKTFDPKSEMYGQDYSIPTPPVPEGEKKSAKDAKLESIFVTFNSDNDEAKVVLKYKNKTITKHLTLEAVVAVSDFYAKMKALKDGLVIELSNSEKIYAVDIKDLYRISTRNPVREGAIAKNSTTASSLYGNFAQQSIINGIIVHPGDSSNSIGASLELLTDQEESILVNLNEDTNGTYIMQIQYFASTPVDKVDYDPETGKKIIYPKYTEYANNISREDIEVTIQDIFDDLPFSKKISNFGKRFANFMIDNRAYYEWEMDVADKFKNCYHSSDIAVVNEFFDTLMASIMFQAEPADDIDSYLVSLVKPNPNFPDVQNAGCVMWTPAF